MCMGQRPIEINFRLGLERGTDTRHTGEKTEYLLFEEWPFCVLLISDVLMRCVNSRALLYIGNISFMRIKDRLKEGKLDYFYTSN